MEEDGPDGADEDAHCHIARMVLVVVDAGQADPKGQSEEAKLKEGPEDRGHVNKKLSPF